MFAFHGPIDRMSALVQVMVWIRNGNNPLPELVLNLFSKAYMQSTHGNTTHVAFCSETAINLKKACYYMASECLE